MSCCKIFWARLPIFFLLTGAIVFVTLTLIPGYLWSSKPHTYLALWETREFDRSTLRSNSTAQVPNGIAAEYTMWPMALCKYWEYPVSPRNLCNWQGPTWRFDLADQMRFDFYSWKADNSDLVEPDFSTLDKSGNINMDFAGPLMITSASAEILAFFLLFAGSKRLIVGAIIAMIGSICNIISSTLLQSMHFTSIWHQSYPTMFPPIMWSGASCAVAACIAYWILACCTGQRKRRERRAGQGQAAVPMIKEVDEESVREDFESTSHGVTPSCYSDIEPVRPVSESVGEKSHRLFGTSRLQ